MKSKSQQFIIIVCILMPVLSFAQIFGKNSVQYDNFDWHFIQSKHFDVYFYPGAENVAGFVADVAESSYVLISNSWNFKLKNRLVLILYRSHNDFGQTNLNYGPPEESVGGFTEFFKNRVVIPYEGSYEQLRHVTHHELTHAIMLYMLFGPNAQSIISGIAHADMPPWFIEGLAEYESRGWDTESDMFIRDAVINGYLPKIDRLHAFLAYKGGQSVFNYIAEKYGEQKVGELLTKIKYSKSTERGLHQSIGVGVEELSKQWHTYLKKKYWPEFPGRREPGDFAEQLTFHEKDKNFINNSGQLSPRGDKIAFLSDRSGFFDVYLFSSMKGMKTKKLVSGQRSGKLEELHWLRPGITWDPGGEKIAFAAKSQNQDALHIVDVNRSKIIQSLKFDLDGIYSPDWSPQGDRLAFVGTLNGFSDIYIYSFKTKELQQITEDVFSDLEPRWSPDASRIVFVSDREDHLNGSENLTIQNLNYHQQDVYIIDVESKAISRITNTQAMEKSPVWSPDGSILAFVSDRNGISNIYLKDVSLALSVLASIEDVEPQNQAGYITNTFNNDRAYPITNVLTGIDHLSWKGGRLAFTCFYRGGFDIFLIKAPQNIKPGDVQPALTHFMQSKKSGKSVASRLRSPKRSFSKTDNSSEKSYRNFVFGDDFKKGRPISAIAPKTGLFLDKDEYKNSSERYRINKYKTRFSLDLLGGGAGFDPFFGFQGGSIISFSDLLGNHRINIHTDIFLDISNSDFAVDYYYLPRQTDIGIGIFKYTDLFFTKGRFLVQDRNLGLNLSVSRPFDRYRRLEFGLNLRTISRSQYETLSEEEVQNQTLSTRVSLFGLSYIKDNTIWEYTGPKAGTRYNISIQASPALGKNGLNFRIYKFDYRKYFNFSRNYTFALRLSAGLSEGSRKQKFFLGGVHNWINLDFRDDVELDLDDIYFSNFVAPVRGFDYYEQVGSKFFLTNLELRIPFVNYFDMRWPLPLRLSNIRGLLFTDVGSAWDSRFNFFTKTSGGWPKLDDAIMSFGWGMRINFGILLLKYDMAWKTDWAHVSGPQSLFSIGTDF
ncbi:MAG: peptidase MA family metallohydrolase [bacterium]